VPPPPVGREPLRKMAALSDGRRRLPGMSPDSEFARDVSQLGIRKTDRANTRWAVSGSRLLPTYRSCHPVKRLPSRLLGLRGTYSQENKSSQGKGFLLVKIANKHKKKEKGLNAPSHSLSTSLVKAIRVCARFLSTSTPWRAQPGSFFRTMS
jgi:hypothetical protein